MDEKLIKKRRQNIIFAVVSFLSGGVCYGFIGAITFSKAQIVQINSPYLYVLFTFLLGGYIIFSITCGIIVTVNWLSKMSMRQKIIFVILWIIPIYSVFLGLLYSVPYLIYNIIKLKQIKNSKRNEFLKGGKLENEEM